MFKVGDVVRLKSGSMPMTVVATYDATKTARLIYCDFSGYPSSVDGIAFDALDFATARLGFENHTDKLVLLNKDTIKEIANG